MTRPITRRRAIQGLGVAGAAMLLRIDTDAQGQPLTVFGQPAELRLTSVSPNTIRVSVLPWGACAGDLNRDGALANFPEQPKSAIPGTPVKMGDVTVTMSAAPLQVRVA